MGAGDWWVFLLAGGECSEPDHGPALHGSPKPCCSSKVRKKVSYLTIFGTILIDIQWR